MRVGAMIPAGAVVMTRFVFLLRTDGTAILVAMLPGWSTERVHPGLGGRFVMDDSIANQSRDRLDRSARQKGKQHGT